MEARMRNGPPIMNAITTHVFAISPILPSPLEAWLLRTKPQSAKRAPNPVKIQPILPRTAGCPPVPSVSPRKMTPPSYELNTSSRSETGASAKGRFIPMPPPRPRSSKAASRCSPAGAPRAHGKKHQHRQQFDARVAPVQHRLSAAPAFENDVVHCLLHLGQRGLFMVSGSFASPQRVRG